MPADIISCDQLTEIHQLCVDRINMYRAGTLVFSTGKSDPALGSPSPLTHTPEMDQCHSGKHFCKAFI
jgi:hypothetical protein